MNSDAEIWKPIPGWPYEASDLGRIRNAKNQRVLKPIQRCKRYFVVDLHRPGEVFHEYVHRLILLAFRGPAPEGHEAAHKDDAWHDNRLEILRWATHQENCAERKHYTRAKAAQEAAA